MTMCDALVRHRHAQHSSYRKTRPQSEARDEFSDHTRNDTPVPFGSGLIVITSIILHVFATARAWPGLDTESSSKVIPPGEVQECVKDCGWLPQLLGAREPRQRSVHRVLASSFFVQE